MTFFDPDKAYLQHTDHYKLPHGRMWPVDGVPGASGIGPLYEAEHSKFGVIDFQLRGAARALGNGVNYVSGIITEGEYGQYEYEGEVTVSNEGFQGILNDVVIGRSEDGISWNTLNANEENYLFVKLVEGERGEGAYLSSRRNNDLITFAQDNPEHPNQESMLVAYRPSGTNSQIQTDIASKVYTDLNHHITSKNPHGDPWMQSGVIVNSGTIVQGQALATGNATINSGLSVSDQTDLSSELGFTWPDGIFQNDLSIAGTADHLDNAVFEQVSGSDMMVGQLHITHKRFGTPYNSGALAGPGAAPLVSGSNQSTYNFGDLHQSGNIVFGNPASTIDGVRPELNGAQLDNHVVLSQNPHHLTPVRLSGVGRLGVGDPNQWGVNPNTPPANSPYWRMQGNWPVTSGISLDGIDMSVMQKHIDGTVVDRQAPQKSVAISGVSIYRFEESSGSIFKDSSDNFDLDELNNITHQQSSVNASFGYSVLMTSGTGILKTTRPIPKNRKEPFSFSGWFNGPLIVDTQSGVTLAEHVDQNNRGWALTKEAYGSGVRLEMFSQQDGGKAIIRNTLDGIVGGAWNHITGVYDGSLIYVGVNGQVSSGIGPENGWGDGVAEGGDHKFALLAPDENIWHEGQKRAYTLPFTVADLSNGLHSGASAYGAGEPLYSIYEEVQPGIFKLRKDTILLDDGTSFTVYEPNPSKRYAGKVVYTDAGGDAGVTKEAIASGTGWTDLHNGVFAHGFIHGSGVKSMLENFFISSDGLTYSGITAQFQSDGIAASWMRSGLDVYGTARGIVSAGIRGTISVDAKDFSSLDFVSSGAGGYEYTYKHPYKSSDIIIDVWERQKQPLGSFAVSQPDVIINPPDDMEVLVDTEEIKIQVPDPSSVFRGKLVIADGQESIGGNYSNGRVDDVAYEVGKAWPEFQQDYTVPVVPFTSGINKSNPSSYYHKHLMLPPEGEFVSIAPEYPSMVLSGHSPGTFESSRRHDQNWYDWYAYKEDDVIIYTRIPVPTGTTKLSSLKMKAHTSPGGENLSKFKIQVKDTDDGIVNAVVPHWLHPAQMPTDYVFSGGGIGSDLGGTFESGKKLEVAIRMRSVSGHGIHIGPLTARFQ
jgi:hypothetical protein